jgi:hypothetical protein
MSGSTPAALPTQAPIFDERDPDLPFPFGERVTDDYLQVAGMLCQVATTTTGARYWISVEDCPVHTRPYKLTQTATGQLFPWRHAVLDERDIVSYCVWTAPKEDEDA